MARAGAGAAASHVATREARLPADATALLQTHAVTSMTFGAASMPAEVAMLHVLRALTRAPRSGCGSLGGAAQVSREWRALAEMLRAWRPACALDVRSQLHHTDDLLWRAVSDRHTDVDLRPWLHSGNLMQCRAVHLHKSDTHVGSCLHRPDGL